jgi:predicted DNA-binding transcriptional regulator AlpA
VTEARLEKSKSRISKNQGDYWASSPKEPTGRLLSLAEIEEEFGLTEYRIYRWVAEGHLHAVQVGKRMRYPDWEVRAILSLLYSTLAGAAA